VSGRRRQSVEPFDAPRRADYRNVRDPELLKRSELFMCEGRLGVRRLLAGGRFRPRSVFVTRTALDPLAVAVALDVDQRVDVVGDLPVAAAQRGGRLALERRVVQPPPPTDRPSDAATGLGGEWHAPCVVNVTNRLGGSPMPQRERIRPRLGRAAPRTILMVGILGLVALPATSAEVYRDDERDIRVSLDTTVSIGASVRTEKRDKELIWAGHGGKNTWAASGNADDGNLNYDRWDFYSTLMKGTSELEAVWGNYGAFFRASAFWDPISNCTSPGSGAPEPFTLPEDSSGFDSPKCFSRTQLDGAARWRANPLEGGVVGAQFRILDAYMDGAWDVFERPVSLRVGNQFISWGEGFFYQGINQINQVDVTRLRVPGSEIKEALMPAPMVRLQADFFDNLSVDAYYQFWWFPTDLDPTGSYFSDNDLVGRGASLPASGEGETQGLFQPNVFGEFIGVADILDPIDPGGTGQTPEEIFALGLLPRSRGGPRVGDDDPSSQGQGGVALRYFLEQAQAELGVYYVRYHSKTPAVGYNAYGIPENPISGAQNAPWDYFAQYADDVSLVGASFATQVLGAAVAGEVSYRWNDPIPINGLVGPALTPDGGPGFGGTSTRVDGFVREERFQFILNYLASFARGTRLIGPAVDWLRADDISFLAEWGLVFYPSLDDSCVPVGNYGLPIDERPSTIQEGCTAYAGPVGTGIDVDDVSWGYQIRIGPNYFNPFGLPIRLQPSISWLHDVSGVTPGLNPYVGERKAVSLGVEVIYLDTWTGRINYANFFGAGAANSVNDRDFLSFSLSYAF